MFRTTINSENFVQLLFFCKKLGRSLTFRHNLVAMRKKLASPVTLLKQLASSGWGAGAKTLHTTALSLNYKTVEYHASARCCSVHTCLINSVLNYALLLATRCLRPTNLYFQASSQQSFIV